MSVVWDYEQVQRFVALFGADLGPHQALVVNLLARRKYNAALPKDRVTLDRAVINRGQGPERLLRWRADAFPAGLCVYMNPNPVNVTTALAKTLWECQVDATRLVYKTMMANVARAHDTQLAHLDVDTKEPARLRAVAAALADTGVQPLVRCTIETANGYHVVYRHDKAAIKHAALHAFQQSTAFTKPNVRGAAVEDHWFSVCRGGLVAVPGTLQGGHRVRFVPGLPSE